jgi:hypothetical protein
MMHDLAAEDSFCNSRARLRRYTSVPLLCIDCEWNQVFPNAACVVTLVDRLVHRSEIRAIEGDRYRFKEVQGSRDRRRKSRATRNRNPHGRTHDTEGYAAHRSATGTLRCRCVATFLQFLYDLTEALERTRPPNSSVDIIHDRTTRPKTGPTQIPAFRCSTTGHKQEIHSAAKTRRTAIMTLVYAAANNPVPA